MTDPLSRADLALNAAEEFFDLARNASSPFMRAYYERVALRYLSSEGELNGRAQWHPRANTALISKDAKGPCAKRKESGRSPCPAGSAITRRS
jgi:hypothetical protein